MNNGFKSGLLVAALAFTGSAAFAEGKAPHWGYSGTNGPEHWSELAPEFSACAAGKNQSPIDLSNLVEAELPAISFQYQAGGYEVVNNGHAIQVNYNPGSTMTVAGHEYELKQFHFHSPSENTIEGKPFPLEAHLVHADKAGNLAVIALMFAEGESNSAIAPAWSKMPAKAGQNSPLKTPIDAYSLLPSDQAYYRFNGSLTTPPCSEGVTWLVMKAFGSVSTQQLSAFNKVLPFDNNRPVQPLNARIIVQ